ncbi:unnamed protein product [Cylindrotheca closterium]|uniref:Uncharacterized protein n=1 Tax=Cylindrotheca closterium TaxID=2856 RepID=A0AAD2FW32_9STRA|nr:unnamed protein product [Cylindrotheca closterium]
MAKSLQSYFRALATELNVDLERTTIHPDNARTIKGSFDDSVFECQPDESTSRWMESSSSSDVSLSVPGRRSSIDNLQPFDDIRATTICQQPVIGNTERWLRELPMESQEQGLPHDEIPTSAQRVRSFDDELRTDSFEADSDTDDDIPFLNGYRFGTDEKHPASNLLALNREGLIQYPPMLCEIDNPKYLIHWNDEDSREDTSSNPSMQNVAFVKQENLLTCKSDVDHIASKTSRPHSRNRKSQKGHAAAFEPGLASWMSLDRKASFE